MSGSEKYHNETIETVINDYAAEYHHSFMLATAEMESELYGIWQVWEYVGHKALSGTWDGMVGEVVIFSEAAWIDSSPSFKPVYAYYKAYAEEMETDGFLENVVWKDGRYSGLNGRVILGLHTQDYFGRVVDSTDMEDPIKMIMMDDCLIIERSGSYFELEKLGEIEWYENIEPRW